MNYTKLLTGGLASGLANYLAGWILYGILFAGFFDADSENMNLVLIAFGCFTFGFFVSFVFLKWAHISSAIAGLKAGLIIGLFLGLWSNFFMWSNKPEVDYTLLGLDVAISIVLGGLTGLVAAAAMGKRND